MSNEDIVRAWKDAAYRQSLSDEEQALLPEHPAGAIELADEELRLAPGRGATALCTNVTCANACTIDVYCQPGTTTTLMV